MKTLYKNAKIFTANDEALYADAMVVEDGVITAISADGSTQTPEVGGAAAATLNEGALAALVGTKLADVDTKAIDSVTGATSAQGELSASSATWPSARHAATRSGRSVCNICGSSAEGLSSISCPSAPAPITVGTSTRLMRALNRLTISGSATPDRWERSMGTKW